MTYEVQILRSAQKQLASIHHDDQERLIAAIRTLAKQPRPSGCTKLSGREVCRIRVGPYRILYEIHDDRLVILILFVAHRREAYRDL